MMGDTHGGGDPDAAPIVLQHRPTRTSSVKPVDLEGELGEILRRRSLGRGRSESQGSGEPRTSRTSSLRDFNIFKKSITYDSQYKEYEEEVVFVEPEFHVKRVVSPQGELMLSALSGVSRKMEILAMLPEIMGQLVYGNMELEQILGVEAVDAILRLYFVQAHWIEYRKPAGEEPFRVLGATLSEIKKRLQKGARYPPPHTKRKSIRLIIKESLGNEEEGEEDGEDADEEVEEENLNSANPVPSSIISSSILTSASASFASFRVHGYDEFVTPGDLGIPSERYMADVVKAGYREVFRLLYNNHSTMNYLVAKIQPEVTQAVKVLYGQIQLLEGLMYVKFLMSPEEEIQRLQHLKQIWIKEQRLLREYRGLEEEFEELGNNRERVMYDLNAGINDLIVKIDSMSDYARYEINKSSAEGNKQDLVNAKKFDQDLQQLDGNFQSALKFAMKLRATYSEIENGWRKQRFKLEADLEALISNYDKEMKARQQAMDDCLMTEEANKLEIARLEKVNQKVEARYAQFKDETRVRKVRKRKRSKKKKGKKGKKGKRGRSGKKKLGKSKSKSKSPGKKVKKSKGSKGKGKKKKKGKKSRSETASEAEFEDGGEFEYGSEEEGEEGAQKPEKKKKGKKSKKGKKAPPTADPGQAEVNDPTSLPLGDDIGEEEETEEDEEEMHRVEALALQKGAKVTINTASPSSEKKKKGKKSKKKGSKKGKRKKK